MKTTSSQKVKIGLFVAIGLAVLFFGIFLIGNQKSMFSSTFNVYGIFRNVNGLQVGNNVRFAGINVGVVGDIVIESDSSVKVTLTLNNTVKKFIKKDSKMSIGSDGLMGDKLMVIAPGGAASTETVSGGEQLTAVNPMDMDKLMAKLSKMGESAGSLIDNLSQIVAKVNNGKGSIGRLLNSDKLSRDLEGTVKQAQTTMANVHNTSSTLNEDLKAAQGNFLLKGFFNKKKKAEKARQDSIKKAQEKAQKEADKAAKKKSEQ